MRELTKLVFIILLAATCFLLRQSEMQRKKEIDGRAVKAMIAVSDFLKANKSLNKTQANIGSYNLSWVEERTEYVIKTTPRVISPTVLGFKHPGGVFATFYIDKSTYEVNRAVTR